MPTVGELIEDARLEDPSFTARRHTDHVLRRALGKYHRELAGKVAVLGPEQVAEEYVIELPLDDHEAGHELVDDEDAPLRYKRIYDVGEVRLGDNRLGEFRLIGQGARWGARREATGWMRQGRLYLVGDAKQWKGYSEIRLYYVPDPVTDLELVDEPFLHDEAAAVYVALLAYRMARRGAKELQRPMADFRGEWKEVEKEFLSDVAGKHVVKDSIRVVW